jgi:hypothetical protein
MKVNDVALLASRMKKIHPRKELVPQGLECILRPLENPGETPYH